MVFPKASLLEDGGLLTLSSDGLSSVRASLALSLAFLSFPLLGHHLDWIIGPCWASLDLSYLLKGPASKHSHTGDEGFNTRILGETQFSP